MQKKLEAIAQWRTYQNGSIFFWDMLLQKEGRTSRQRIKDTQIEGKPHAWDAWTYQRTTNDPSRGRQDGPGAKAKGKEGTCRLYVTTHENPGVIGFARRRIISRRLNGSCTIKTTSIVKVAGASISSSIQENRSQSRITQLDLPYYAPSIAYLLFNTLPCWFLRSSTSSLSLSHLSLHSLFHLTSLYLP